MSLNIVETTPKRPRRKPSNWLSAKVEMEAKWERYWKNPPTPTCCDDDRYAKSWDLIKGHLGQWVCDLGCGHTPLLPKLLQEGCSIDAVDISNNCLKKLPKHERLHTFQEAHPKTRREDFFYDLVLALDLIAELPKLHYRLFFAEVSRLMKREGLCLISTPLDFRTKGPHEAFLSLMQTEFTVLEVICSHHALWHRWKRWAPPSLFRPLEQCTQFLFPERGISHVIALGKKKPLT